MPQLEQEVPVVVPDPPTDGDITALVLDGFEDDDDDLDLVLDLGMDDPDDDLDLDLDLSGDSGETGLDLDLDLGLTTEAVRATDPAPAPIPEASTEPPPPAVSPEAIAEAIATLQSSDGDDDEACATLRAAGDAGLDALFAVFPGPIRVDRYSTGDSVPVNQHGPVLQAIAGFEGAGPRLAERCEALAPEVRYYAVFMFTVVRHPPSVASVAQCLVDKDRSVRDMAVRVARTYRSDDVFGALIAYLSSIAERGRLGDRRVAAETLGALHCADGAPALIAMLGAPQPPLRDAAARALTEIARQDLGTDVWRWRTWFDRNRRRPRIEWLIDGLGSDKRAIQVGAVRELRRVTHLNFGFVPGAPVNTRRDAQQRWLRWWQQTGHAQFSRYR